MALHRSYQSKKVILVSAARLTRRWKKQLGSKCNTEYLGAHLERNRPSSQMLGQQASMDGIISRALAKDSNSFDRDRCRGFLLE